MVTYPMAFRHIKIVNHKDRVLYKFDFISTALDDIKEQNRQNVISYSTLAGFEKDRTLEFTYFKKKPRSAQKRYRQKENQVIKIITSAFANWLMGRHTIRIIPKSRDTAAFRIRSLFSAEAYSGDCTAMFPIHFCLFSLFAVSPCFPGSFPLFTGILFRQEQTPSCLSINGQLPGEILTPSGRTRKF